MSWLLGLAVAGGILALLLTVDQVARRRRDRRRTRQRAARIARLRTPERKDSP